MAQFRPEISILAKTKKKTGLLSRQSPTYNYNKILRLRKFTTLSFQTSNKIGHNLICAVTKQKWTPLAMSAISDWPDITDQGTTTILYRLCCCYYRYYIKLL